MDRPRVPDPLAPSVDKFGCTVLDRLAIAEAESIGTQPFHRYQAAATLGFQRPPAEPRHYVTLPPDARQMRTPDKRIPVRPVPEDPRVPSLLVDAPKFVYAAVARPPVFTPVRVCAPKKERVPVDDTVNSNAAAAVQVAASPAPAVLQVVSIPPEMQVNLPAQHTAGLETQLEYQAKMRVGACRLAHALQLLLDDDTYVSISVDGLHYQIVCDGAGKSLSLTDKSGYVGAKAYIRTLVCTRRVHKRVAEFLVGWASRQLEFAFRADHCVGPSGVWEPVMPVERYDVPVPGGEGLRALFRDLLREKEPWALVDVSLPFALEMYFSVPFRPDHSECGPDALPGFMDDGHVDWNLANFDRFGISDRRLFCRLSVYFASRCDRLLFVPFKAKPRWCRIHLTGGVGPTRMVPDRPLIDRIKLAFIPCLSDGPHIVPSGVATTEFYNERGDLLVRQESGGGAVYVRPSLEFLAPHGRLIDEKREFGRFVGRFLYPTRSSAIRRLQGKGVALERISDHVWYDPAADRVYVTVYSTFQCMAYAPPRGAFFGKILGDAPGLTLDPVPLDLREARESGDVLYVRMDGPCGTGWHALLRDEDRVYYLGPKSSARAYPNGQLHMPQPVLCATSYSGASVVVTPDGCFDWEVMARVRNYVALGIEVGSDPVPYIDGKDVVRGTNAWMVGVLN